MKYFSLLLNLILSFQFATQSFASSMEVADLNEALEQVSQSSEEFDFKKRDMLLNSLEQKIQCLSSKTQSKDQFLAKYRNLLSQHHKNRVKMVKKTLRPKKLVKYVHNVQKNNPELSEEVIVDQLTSSIDQESLITEESQLMAYLASFKNEKEFLSSLKDVLLGVVGTLAFVVLLALVLALIGGIVWGVVATFAIGSVLAITGGLLSLVFALPLVLLGIISSVQLTKCYIDDQSMGGCVIDLEIGMI